MQRIVLRLDMVKSFFCAKQKTQPLSMVCMSSKPFCKKTIIFNPIVALGKSVSITDFAINKDQALKIYLMYI